MDEAVETRRFSPRPEGGRPGQGAGVLHAQRAPSAGRLLAVASPGRASSGVSSYTGRDHFRSEATLTPSRHLTCLSSPLPPLGGLGLRREHGGGQLSPRLREHSSAHTGAAAGWEAAVTCWSSPRWACGLSPTSRLLLPGKWVPEGLQDLVCGSDTGRCVPMATGPPSATWVP